MNFTSINKPSRRLSLRSLRLCVLCVKSRDASTSIKPGFSDWIGSRWRTGTGLFSAVRLSFQRSADPFGQISWPQSSATKSEFLFAPTIQLTLNSFPVTNMFRESHTRNLQTSHHSIAGPVFDVRNFLKSARASNTFHFQSSFFSTYWPTVFALKGQMHSPGSHVETLNRSTALHTATQRQATERFFAQLTGILSSRSVTHFSETTERPTLTTISSSVPNWTQLLSNLLHHTALHQESSRLLRTTVIVIDSMENTVIMHHPVAIFL